MGSSDTAIGCEELTHDHNDGAEYTEGHENDQVMSSQLDKAIYGVPLELIHDLRILLADIFRNVLKKAPDPKLSREAFLEQLRTATEVTCTELTAFMKYQAATVGEACGNEWFKVFKRLVLEVTDEIEQEVSNGKGGPLSSEIIRSVGKHFILRSGRLPIWAASHRHKLRLDAYNRGYHQVRIKLRSDGGLPRLGGGDIGPHFRHQYFKKFGVYPYDLLSIEDVQSKKYLAALRKVAIEDRKRWNKRRKSEKLKIRAREALGKADETLKSARKRWKLGLQNRIRNDVRFLDKSEGDVIRSENRRRYTLCILQEKPFTKLRRRRRLLKEFIRETRLFLFEFGSGEGPNGQGGESECKVQLQEEEVHLQEEEVHLQEEEVHAREDEVQSWDGQVCSREDEVESNGEDAEGNGRVLCDDTDSDTTEMSESSGSESESKNWKQHEACTIITRDRYVKTSEAKGEDGTDVESEYDADVEWEDSDSEGWEEHIEDLIAYEIERENKRKKWSAQRLVEAREQLVLDPKFQLLPWEKKRWLYKELPQFEDCSQGENQPMEGREMHSLIVGEEGPSNPPPIAPALVPERSRRPFTVLPHIQTSPLSPPGILALISVPPGASSSAQPHPSREPYTTIPPVGAQLTFSAAGYTHAHGQPQPAARQTGSPPPVAGASGPAWVGPSSPPLGQLISHSSVNEEAELVLPPTPRPRHAELAPSEPSSLAYSQPSFRSSYVQKSPVQSPPKLLWERPERTPENEWQFGIVIPDSG